MTQIELEFVKWAGTTVSTLGAAYVGLRLALQKSKSAKRWEAKYESYREILSAIHDMYFWASETYSSNCLLPSVGKDKLKELRAGFDNAQHKLWGFVHFGGLLISDSSREALKELLSALSQEEFRFESEAMDDDDLPNEYTNHLERLRSIIDERRSGIERLAKADVR
jgi:hypothetical protein